MVIGGRVYQPDEAKFCRLIERDGEFIIQTSLKKVDRFNAPDFVPEYADELVIDGEHEFSPTMRKRIAALSYGEHLGNELAKRFERLEAYQEEYREYLNNYPKIESDNCFNTEK